LINILLKTFGAFSPPDWNRESAIDSFFMYFVYILHSDSIKNFIVDIRSNESIANRISFK